MPGMTLEQVGRQAVRKGYNRFAHALLLEQEGFKKEAMEQYRSFTHDPVSMVRLAQLSDNAVEKAQLYKQASEIYYNSALKGDEEGLLGYRYMVETRKVAADEQGEALLKQHRVITDHDDDDLPPEVIMGKNAKDALEAIDYKQWKKAPRNENVYETTEFNINQALKSFRRTLDEIKDLPPEATQRINLLFRTLERTRNDHLKSLKNESTTFLPAKQFVQECKEAIERAESDLKNTRDLGEKLTNFFEKLLDKIAKVIPLGKSDPTVNNSSKASRAFKEKFKDLGEALSTSVVKEPEREQIMTPKFK